MIRVPEPLRAVNDVSTDADRMALRRLARRARHMVEMQTCGFPDIAAISQARFCASLDDCARRFRGAT